MDTNPLDLMRKVWRHSGVKGHVWVPHIYAIGVKDKQRFREGATLDARRPQLPEMRDSVDWYWTPAVSSSDSRKAGDYPAQRVLWVDCDDSYDDKLLQALKPSYVWQTSPGHKQAIWLMHDRISPAEYHRDGLMGMLAQALGGDKSGVDIGQLLRVPGSWHHKREPFQGKVLSAAGTVYTQGQLLAKVARGLGFKPGLASELGADDPYGDRSVVLWRFARNAQELGIPQDLTFKLLKATKWNKWKDDPERLQQDVAKAYAAAPVEDTKTDTQEDSGDDQHDTEVTAWDMATPQQFGRVMRTPIRWVLPGIVQEAGVGMLVAAPKVGKSRLALEMVLGLATGKQALGINLRGSVPVGFLSMEDGDRLVADRLNKSLNTEEGRYKYHWDGHIAPDLTWHPPVQLPMFTHFTAADLSSAEDKQRLLETIQRYGLKLVVIDTLGMAIGDNNVSDQKEMNGILKDVRLIARSTDCAILFIHHTRKRVFEKGESVQESILGSTALHAWCEFVLSLASPEEGSDMLRLGVQTKMGNDQHYLDSKLRIVKRPPAEDLD